MHDFDDPVVPDAAESDRESVPLWMTLAVVVLILAILGVVGALVYSVFVTEEVPISLEERDLIFYKDAVANNPQSATAHISLAQAYIQVGDYERAVSEGDKAISLDAKDLGGYLAKGLALENAGSYQQAIAVYDQALEFMPTHPAALLRKGLTLAAMGDLDGAIEAVEASLTDQPTASDVLVELGRLYEAKGDAAAAREKYEKALEFVPDYAPALEALQRLDAS
ncbi:MAG: tetratricopeptide repeat protein [Thermoleophilia bacterium]